MERILKDGAALGLTLAFVWNRNSEKLKGLVPDELILADLSSFANRCKHTHMHYKPLCKTQYYLCAAIDNMHQMF